VDRDQLTSGSTFHSAGLVGQLRGSVVPRREAPSQSHGVVGFAWNRKRRVRGPAVSNSLPEAQRPLQARRMTSYECSMRPAVAVRRRPFPAITAPSATE
jgi:hypothetical protein